MWKFISRMVVAGALVLGGLSEFGVTRADDWPMLGRDGSRNSVSAERGAPTDWSIEEREGERLIHAARGVRWLARLGAMTTSSPVVSGGLVWIGTNNWRPDMQTGDKQHSVLRCFRVSDGQQVFEYVSPHLPHRDQDPGWLGLGSSPLIEGDRLWLVTNRAEVVCLDIGPLRRGDGPPRELWKLDLIAKFAPFQRMPSMGPARPCSIGASWNGRLFVTINNGVEILNGSVPKPDAPSLVCLNKETGELLWKDNSPGANILLTQFASPTLAEIAGKMQVIVPQSDGWVRAFDPASGEKLWEFDVNLKPGVYLPHNGRSTRNSLVGNAVVVGVESLVTFENKDLFTADLSNADVLAVYLLPQQLAKLLPQLEKMKPGSRVVSHQFEIPGFPADKTLRIRSTEDGQEHAVHLWTLPLPKPMRRITWQNIHIYHTAFSPDGQWFLGGGDTNVAHIWEVASGKRLVELPVPIAHFTPDGKQLVGHNQSQNVFVFDAVSGREVRRWETPSPVISLAIAPNGKQVVSGHADNVLRQWEFATGQEIRKLEGHTERATAIFSPDSQRVLSASRDKSIRLWNADSGQLLRTFADFQNATPIPSHDLIVQAFLLPDGQQIAGYVWGNEKSLIVWNAETGAVVRKFDLGANHHKEVAISPDGRWFLTGHSDRTVRVRDLMTSTEVRRWEMQGVYVPRALSFSPDSRLVLAGSHRGLINLWQLQTAP